MGHLQRSKSTLARSREHSSACGYCVHSASPVRMAAFEFGNLGADVCAPLNQQIVVRDLLLRPLPGVGAEGRKFLYAFLDHGQLSVQLIELCGPLHCCCSPKVKKTQRGVG